MVKDEGRDEKKCSGNLGKLDEGLKTKSEMRTTYDQIEVNGPRHL